MGIKNTELDADFEFVEKVAKNSRWKIYQRKSTEKLRFFIFFLCAKVLGL